MKDERSEQRFMCADIVKVPIAGPAQDTEVFANLEDISPSGACVQLDAAAQVGADIEMVCRKCSLKGKVRYCRFAEIGYDVGIAFDNPGSWNERRFLPRHLLVLDDRVAVNSAMAARSRSAAEHLDWGPVFERKETWRIVAVPARRRRRPIAQWCW
jgi:hypothetical protein